MHKGMIGLGNQERIKQTDCPCLPGTRIALGKFLWDIVLVAWLQWVGHPPSSENAIIVDVCRIQGLARGSTPSAPRTSDRRPISHSSNRYIPTIPSIHSLHINENKKRMWKIFLRT